MKKVLLLLTFAISYFVQAESVQIHHIGVGQGDATLIIITNDKGQSASIIIDAGNSTGKGLLVANAVAQHPEPAANKRIDMIITSHLHSDHLGGVATMMQAFLENGWKIGYVIDRGGDFVTGADWDCYNGTDKTELDNDPSQPVPTTVLVSTYNAFVEALKKNNLIIQRLNIAVGLNVIPYFLKEYGFSTKFTCLSSNALVCNKANGTTCEDWQDCRSNVRNENDYSYSFLLELGSFKYFTGGDIGGEAPYVNLETPMLAYFRSRPDAGTFHFCAYKASHHGSEHSTNTDFISFTKPTVTVVPSALRSFSGTKLPSQATLARIATSSTNSNLFYTYEFTTNAYSGAISNYRDVIFSVNGATFETNHQVTVTSFLRSKTSPYTASTTQTTNTITCNKH